MQSNPMMGSVCRLYGGVQGRCRYIRNSMMSHGHTSRKIPPFSVIELFIFWDVCSSTVDMSTYFLPGVMPSSTPPGDITTYDKMQGFHHTIATPAVSDVEHHLPPTQLRDPRECQMLYRTLPPLQLEFDPQVLLRPQAHRTTRCERW
jgi:hypothetical protein